MERSATVLLESATDPVPVLAEALRILPADDGVPPEPGAALALVSAAEHALAAGTVPAETWHRYLDRTRRREFLLALPDAAARTRRAREEPRHRRAACEGHPRGREAGRPHSRAGPSRSAPLHPSA